MKRSAAPAVLLPRVQTTAAPVPDNGNGAIRHANRQRILAVANTVFACPGFAAASPAAIAAAAGLPKADVHDDFGSRQQL